MIALGVAFCGRAGVFLVGLEAGVIEGPLCSVKDCLCLFAADGVAAAFAFTSVDFELRRLRSTLPTFELSEDDGGVGPTTRRG